MPTPEEVQAWRTLRGRFLNALWDAEHAGIDFAQVSDLLRTSGAADLPEPLVDRLIENLSADGLIEGITFAEASANQVHLTSAGRYEVEQWLAEPDQPTAHLPVPASQVFNIGSMHVTGPVLQGSSAERIVTSYGVSGDVLQQLVAEYRKLLAAVELSEDDREEIDADLGIIEEEAATAQPRRQRLRPLLRRLQTALTTGALGGVEAGARDEVMQLLADAKRAIAG